MSQEVKNIETTEVGKLIEKFVSNYSHELKSPVSSMLGLLEIMQYYPNHQETNKCITMMTTCASRMDQMIRSLDEYMVNERESLLPESVNAEVLVAEVLNQFHASFHQQNIYVRTEVYQQTIWITDKHRIKVVLRNLIANAITFQDYKKEEKRIIIRLKVYENRSVLEVIDNGVGIQKDKQYSIFDLFYRGHEQSEGSGLGLFLLKSIVQKMSGRIALKSIESIGTEMKIIFPNYLSK